MKRNRKTVGYLTFSALMCCLALPYSAKAQCAEAPRTVVSERDVQLSLNAGCSMERILTVSEAEASAFEGCNAGISLTVEKYVSLSEDELKQTNQETEPQTEEKPGENEENKKEDAGEAAVTASGAGIETDVSEKETVSGQGIMADEAIPADGPQEELPEVPEEEQIPYLIANVEERLNIREQPEEEADVIGHLSNGSMAYILEDLEGWYHISSGGIEGYVSKDYCMTGDEAASFREANGERRVVVKVSFLNIRQQPDEESEIVDVATEGQSYPIVSEEKDWYQISYNEEQGYVSSHYAKAEYVLPEAEQAEPPAEEELPEEEILAESEEEEAAEEAYASSYSDSDLELLAALIYCEAGGECYEGQLAVGAVVMNRVRSGAYPDNIHDVIYQSGQFMPTWTGVLDNALSSGARCYEAAQEAMSGVDNVNGALEFRMASSGYSGTVIGNQVFF